MLVVIKAILYERTVALCASMDFGKGLGRSEPWGDCSRWSRRKKETMKTAHGQWRRSASERVLARADCSTSVKRRLGMHADTTAIKWHTPATSCIDCSEQQSSDNKTAMQCAWQWDFR